MNSRILRLALLTCAFVSPIAPRLAFAQTATPNQNQGGPFLHALFSDNAVLQRDRTIPVWGWTAPGQSVSIKLDNKTVTAVADATGKWTAQIGPYPAGGPHTLTVSGGAETVTRQNILFGDVWLCSGQSNMEQGMGIVNNAKEEIAAANYPQIRLFSVPKRTSTTPLSNVNSSWLVCNPTNIAAGGWGGFSGVAYFFGRKLQQELKIPIGLIHSSWGGTEAESWLSQSALGKIPDFKPQIAASELASTQPNVPYEQRLNDWLRASDPALDANWTLTGAQDANWKTISLPGNWENAGIGELSEFDGIVLFRREVMVPEGWVGKDLKLTLGAIDDIDSTYWNGEQIGNTSGWESQRQYSIPGAKVKAGRNVIAVRVTDNAGGGGFGGPSEAMRLTLDGNNALPLTGDWKYRVSIPAEKMASMPVQIDPNNPHRVNVLYNGMIAPLEPYGLKGAIWYQGESNASRAEQYGRLLPLLIRDWRQRFNSPLPFHIVQLAGFMAPDDSPKNDDWPQIRAAQMRIAQSVERTGIAIATDIGEEKDIHPRNKQDVGLRLALSALAQDYGQKVVYSGPTLKTVTPQGANLVLTFANADGGLTLKGDAGRVFAVAGADRNWFWATAKTEGERVILNSSVVPKPLYARYAWSNMPRATLYNGAMLPAPPFQSIP